MATTTDLAFGALAPLLVVLHALAAIALIGASTHHAWIARAAVLGRPRPRLGRIYGTTVAVAYGVTFVLGLLAYPEFRVHVRAAVLDHGAPWAANLFDTKETLAVLALPLVVTAAALARWIGAPGLAEARALAWIYAVTTWLMAAIVWFAVVSGLAITLVRGVGGAP